MLADFGTGASKTGEDCCVRMKNPSESIALNKCCRVNVIERPYFRIWGYMQPGMCTTSESFATVVVEVCSSMLQELFGLCSVRRRCHTRSTSRNNEFDEGGRCGVKHTSLCFVLVVSDHAGFTCPRIKEQKNMLVLKQSLVE